MGNASLRDIAAISSISFDELAGSVVAIDAHNWLYKYLTTTVKFTDAAAYTTDDGEIPNLIGIIQGLPTLLEAGITPVFVFDGAPTDLKAEEIESRREDRERAEERLEKARERDDPVAVARLESRTQRLTATIHETTRELLDRLDLPVVEAPAEGEAQAAYMARHDPGVDYAGSDDYDTLLFGAPRTLRGVTSSGDPELMTLEATLRRHDLSWEELVDVGVLAGTDFNEGVRGIGPKTAISEIKEHGDLLAVLAARDASIPHAERIRELFLSPDVTEECAFTTDPDPDVERARNYVIGEWGVPAEEVNRGFDRIETALVQTGLDRWT
jgi:flap endonuclease-1